MPCSKVLLYVFHADSLEETEDKVQSLSQLSEERQLNMTFRKYKFKLLNTYIFYLIYFRYIRCILTFIGHCKL